MTNFKKFLSQYESFEISRISRDYAKKRLAKDKSRAAQDILERLKGCRSGSRCFSGVCPVCARKFRLRWLPQAEAVLGDDQTWLQLRWTPPRAAFASGMLVDFDLKDLIEKQQSALKEALPDAVALGGYDLSLNIDAAGKTKWRISSCVFICQPIDQDTIERLTQAHPHHPPYYHSLKICTVVNNPYALSFASKHRIYVSEYKSENPFDGRLTFKPLPHPYVREADLFQERWPLWNRLILHNVTAGTKPHRPVLRRIF